MFCSKDLSGYPAERLRDITKMRPHGQGLARPAHPAQLANRRVVRIPSRPLYFDGAAGFFAAAADFLAGVLGLAASPGQIGCPIG